MTGWPRAYNERMAELGFSTYVFIERIAANAAALHPFPEHNVALVRDALADAGFASRCSVRMLRGSARACSSSLSLSATRSSGFSRTP